MQSGIDFCVDIKNYCGSLRSLAKDIGLTVYSYFNSGGFDHWLLFVISLIELISKNKSNKPQENEEYLASSEGNKEEGLSKGNVMVGHRDNFTSKSALGVDINGK